MTTRHARKRTGGGAARAWVRVGYLLILGFALLSPLGFRWDVGFLAERLARFLSPGALTPGDMVDAVRNVVLLAGWGLVDVVTDRGRSRRERVVSALAGGAVIGLSAELVQLALPTRVPSLLDAAMNTAGAGFGALAADASQRSVRRLGRRPTALGIPAAALAVPYALAALVEAAFPLLRNQEAGLGSGGPIARAIWAAEHFRWESVAVLPALDFLLFLPAGMLVAAAFWEVERTRGRAFVWAAGCGISIAVLGELAHAPLGTPMELGPALVHGAAFVLGAWLAARAFPRWLLARRGEERIRDFLWGFVLILALWRLRPFVPELDPGAIAGEFSLSRWSPLSALGARRDLYSVSDVLRSFLLLAPVGAVLGVGRGTGSAPGERSPLRSLGWIVSLAFTLEAGQALVAGRFFDGTDLAVMAAGGAVAWSLTRSPTG